jgi:replicative DNA helicase
MVPQDSVSIHNIESEKAVLGSILIDSKTLIKAKSWIQDDDFFYNTKNKIIWKAMCDLDSEGIPVDAVSVCAKVKNEAYYITGLSETVATSANVEVYAKQVYEDWLKREIVKQSYKVATDAKDSSAGVHSLLEQLYETTGNLLNLDPTQTFDLDSLLDATKDSIFNGRQLTKTGFGALDNIISGMTKGEITIFAGRPGNAKTTTVANIARNLVLSGKKVVMFNREMPNTEMMKKFIAMESEGITYHALRHNAVTNKEVIENSLKIIKEKYTDKLFMYDNISTIDSTFREIRKIKPDVVIDDHIGLIEYPKNDNRDLRLKIGDTSRRYKWLCKSEQLSVILVSQLNRNIEYRTERIPKLSDLAESGNLEQDAEIVAFTHYPWTVDFESAKHGRFGLDIVVAKNRYGSTGKATVGFSPDCCTIYDTVEEAELSVAKGVPGSLNDVPF